MSLTEIDLSYAMPLLARILAHVTGRKLRLEGPYSLGRYGLSLNIVGLLFLAFFCITFNFLGGDWSDHGNQSHYLDYDREEAVHWA
jgi:hypothetical protein